MINPYVDPDTANVVRVAQAISRNLETTDELYLDDGPGMEDSTLHFMEVGAELHNAANGLMSQFTVTTSDGRSWNVRITPEA